MSLAQRKTMHKSPAPGTLCEGRKIMNAMRKNRRLAVQRKTMLKPPAPATFLEGRKRMATVKTRPWILALTPAKKPCERDAPTFSVKSKTWFLRKLQNTRKKPCEMKSNFCQKYIKTPPKHCDQVPILENTNISPQTGFSDTSVFKKLLELPLFEAPRSFHKYPEIAPGVGRP